MFKNPKFVVSSVLLVLFSCVGICAYRPAAQRSSSSLLFDTGLIRLPEIKKQATWGYETWRPATTAFFLAAGCYTHHRLNLIYANQRQAYGLGPRDKSPPIKLVVVPELLIRRNAYKSTFKNAIEPGIDVPPLFTHFICFMSTASDFNQKQLMLRKILSVRTQTLFIN